MINTELFNELLEKIDTLYFKMSNESEPEKKERFRQDWLKTVEQLRNIRKA